MTTNCPLISPVQSLIIRVADQQGEPFSSLLGAPPETRLQFTLPGQATGMTTRDDGQGYWMMSVLTEELATLRQVAEPAGAQLVREPLTVERPFVGITQAMILRAPGGELLECLQLV
jgi:hypothetical protein